MLMILYFYKKWKILFLTNIGIKMSDIINARFDLRDIQNYIKCFHVFIFPVNLKPSQIASWIAILFSDNIKENVKSRDTIQLNWWCHRRMWLTERYEHNWTSGVNCKHNHIVKCHSSPVGEICVHTYVVCTSIYFTYSYSMHSA